MKLRAGFFEKIIKLINFHPDSLRKKKRFPQIRNKGEFSTDTTEIKRTIKTNKNNYILLKMDNLEEMSKFLQMYNLPRLNQEEIKNMSK